MKINESLKKTRKQSEIISSMKYFPGRTQLGYRRCDVIFLVIASHLTGCSHHVMISICLPCNNKNSFALNVQKMFYLIKPQGHRRRRRWTSKLSASLHVCKLSAVWFVVLCGTFTAASFPLNSLWFLIYGVIEFADCWVERLAEENSINWSPCNCFQEPAKRWKEP